MDQASVRDASYARFRASEALGGTLTKERRPERMRAVLEQILANGRQTIDAAGNSGFVGLVSQTHMQCAAAHADLAGISADAKARDDHLRQCADHADAAVGLALEGKSGALALKVISWAMVVLTSALNVAHGHQRRGLEVRLESCVRSLDEASDRTVRGARQAAKLLFEAQALAEGASALRDAATRATVKAQAVRIAKQARVAALRAGAAELDEQSLAFIRANTAAPAVTSEPAKAPAVASKPAATPAVGRPYPKFCTACGTPTSGKKFCVNCGVRLA